jgi:hypothetical protein
MQYYFLLYFGLQVNGLIMSGRECLEMIMSEQCFCNDFIGGVCRHCYVAVTDQLKAKDAEIVDLKQECLDRADCEKSLSNMLLESDEVVKAKNAEIEALKGEFIEVLNIIRDEGVQEAGELAESYECAHLLRQVSDDIDYQIKRLQSKPEKEQV